MSEPTAEQIRTYLTRTGWRHDSTGPAGTLWVLDRPSSRMNGRRLGVPDDPDTGYPLDGVVKRIALVEGRNPDDVRNNILDVDNPAHAKVRAWAIGTMLDNAAATVRRLADAACDDGWPGVWNGDVAHAMAKQAAALADAFDATAVAIRTAARLEPAAPWHPLWTAVGRAAEVVVLSGPERPDDLEEIKRRLDAMRPEAKEGN